MTELKKVLSILIVAEGQTTEEYLDGFGLQVSVLLETYISSMGDWLKETDDRLTTLFNEFKYQSVGTQDAFSRKLESLIKMRIAMWVAQDDKLRESFKKLYDAYKDKLQFKDMQERLAEEESVLLDELQSLVKKANEFGAKWAEQIDTAGIQIQEPVIRTTILWFKNLTFKEMQKLYQMPKR